MRDIRNILEELTDQENTNALNFEVSEYKDLTGRFLPM
jgi:hypothetical protein